MDQQKKPSDTLRIDLIPGVGAESAPFMRRADWSSTSKVPEYVAQSRYRELLEGLYDGAVVTRFSGRILDVNARTIAAFQYEDWELSRLTIYDIVSGMNQELLDALVANLDRERYSLIQAFCTRKDGSYFPAEISVSRLRLDGPCLCFLIRDITLRKVSEERLWIEHEALLIADCGIVIADANARVQFANPAAARLLAVADAETLFGRPVDSLFADPAAVPALLDGLLTSGGPVVCTGDLQAADGATRRCHITATCKRAEDGEPLGFVMSFREASDACE